MRKITVEERIEEFFRECTKEEALLQRSRIDLILRLRGIDIGGTKPAKRRSWEKPIAQRNLGIE